MKITISGRPGSGKSTVAKKLAKDLGYKHYSTGDFMRQIAKERSISLEELSKEAEKTRYIDDRLDKRQKELGKREDDFVLDARLGFHFIPNSLKIYLKVSDEEAYKRIKKREGNIPYEKVKERLKSEHKRYKELYNVNYEEEENYDVVIDTNKLSVDTVINKIKECI